MKQAAQPQRSSDSTASDRETGYLSQLPVRYAAWLKAHDVPFLVCSIGMIVMLLWAGSYKMTAPGADGIVQLVTHSPLTAWQFRMFGTYHGADLIGATEWTAALLLLSGYIWPRAGIMGGAIATVMFLTTSSMLLTTPDAITVVHGKPFMSFTGLFLYKDILSLGVALFLCSRFGERATGER